MFLHPHHQARPDSIIPLHIATKKQRQITTPPSTWPIAEPPSPTTRFTRMGCGPSRPSRSFYHEYFVERPRKLQKQQQRTGAKSVSTPPRVGSCPREQARNRRPVTIADVKFAEEVAKEDLRIYEEELEAKRREEEQRTFVLHAAMRGEQVFF